MDEKRGKGRENGRERGRERERECKRRKEQKRSKRNRKRVKGRGGREREGFHHVDIKGAECGTNVVEFGSL